jgi:hypothetical protein
MLRGVVLDDDAAIAVGRELMWEVGCDRVVSHQAGDVMTADLGGPHDAVICLPTRLGYDHDRVVATLSRIRAAMRPGGQLITVRSKAVGPVNPDPLVAANALFWRLGSRSDQSTIAQFQQQLTASGFGVPREHDLASAPEASVYIARAV